MSDEPKKKRRAGIWWIVAVLVLYPLSAIPVDHDAHEHQRGLWADKDLVPPWEWRRGKRAASESPR
jgi:hypothetical protein